MAERNRSAIPSDYTNSAALAFWDAYLKGNARAKAYLESNALEEFSHGTAKLSRR